MQTRLQLIHHWLLILLLATVLALGHSLGAWAAAPAADKPTPTATRATGKATATPTVTETDEITTTDPGADDSKGAASQDQMLQPEDESKAVDNLEDASKAVVQIEAVGTFRDPEEGMQMNSAGAGSGFIIDPSGIAVTNNHVATGAAFLKVFVAGEKEPRNARVLGVSECSDLAVIDIEDDNLPYLAWHAKQATVGLKVYALGFPLGDPEFTMTDGIISKAKADGETSWASIGHVLEHTATINPGNSGGPLVDEKGQVVGINYAGNADTKQYFAIAGADAQSVIDELRAGNDVDSLGINGEAVNNGKDIAGIWVSSVASGSPADKVGLKAGDIIVSMEGVTLANQGTMTEYCDILRSHQPDDALSIQVLRLDKKVVLEGQINGRELAQSVSVADEVNKDEGTTASNQASGSGASADYEDYASIATKDQKLSVDVPQEWADIKEGDWKIGEKVVGTQLAAAPDLKAFYDSWSTPGVLISYSESLGSTKEPKDLLSDIDYSDACKTKGEQTDLPDGYFVGAYQTWRDCGDTKTQAVLVALTPAETHDYVVLVEVYAVTESDLKALDHVIDSFHVRDGHEASATADDGQAKGSDINDLVDTSDLTYTYQFVGDPAFSALLPEGWTETKSEDWVIDGDVVGKKFSAAADLKKFQDSWTEPGIFVRTAVDMKEPIKVKEWLDNLDLSDKCKNEGRTKHSHTIYGLTYTGAYDVWSNCEKSDNAYAYLVAVSDPPGQVVAIEFNAMDAADVQAFDVLLKSFFVDSVAQPGAAATDASTSSDTHNDDDIDLSLYNVINDDSGKLSVSVPKAWSAVSSGDWLLNDEKVGLSLTAAPDLKAYNDGWTTPGIFFGVSTELAKDLDLEKFLDSWDYSKDCTYDSRIDYDDSVYAGKYDLWTDCGSKGNLFVVMAVTPKEKADILILLNVAIPADTETQSFKQILTSFDYSESGAATTETPATDTATTDTATTDNPDTAKGTDEDTSADAEPTDSATASAEVIAATLNVRSGPGTNYEKVATINKGQTFSVVGQIDNCAWLKVVDSSNEEGWISGSTDFITLDTSCDQIPEVEAPAAAATPSDTGTANNGDAGSSSSVPAGKGCYNFQNMVGKELTITFTKVDGSWNKTFKVAKSGEHQECFDPGKYTYTMSAPDFESGNNELIISAGDNFDFPISVQN